MRKVLIVAYYFPPLGGAGVQRTLKFVKYLPEFGWQPVVLTVKGEAAPLRDLSLEEEVPEGTSVYRTPALLFPSWLPGRLRKIVAHWLLVVDQQLGWLPFAVAQGQEVVRREGIEAIYTTSAPYTAHLIGLRLKRQTGLPWLADFRDPWVGNFSGSFPTPLHEKIARRLERRISQRAERITVVSEPMRRMLLARHAGLAPDHVLTLPNGYDRADFEGVEPLGQESDRLVIVYTGSFYGQRQTPLYFLQGVRHALDDGRLNRQKVRVHFVGNMVQAIQGQIETLGLTDVVQITGYLSHRQSIGYLFGADLLLLIIGSGPGADAVFTGKIFEYLATGKPILALIPPGVAADLLTEAGIGHIVPPDVPEVIANALTDLFVDWCNGQLNGSPDPDVVVRYDRRQQTSQLAQILGEISR